MAIISKMEIIGASDLKQERVAVPEWGPDAEVIVQEMSALDRDWLNANLAKSGAFELDADEKPTHPEAMVNYAGMVLVRCLVDETGARLFVDEEAEALGKKNVAVINRLFSVATKLNVLEVTDAEIKK